MENNNLTIQQKAEKDNKLTLKITLSEYLVTARPRGIVDVMNSKAGILRKLILERGEDEIKAMIVNMIVKLCEFFNFNRTMNTEQILETADIIIQEYPIYTPEDLILCFRGIKTLRYGKFMEGIDGAKLLEMIRKYDIEREEKWIEEKQKQSQNQKADNKKMSDPVYGVSKTLLEKASKTKDILNTPLKPSDDPLQKYLIEFDELYKKQSPEGTGIKIVDYKNEKMGIDRYLSYRHAEDKLN